MSKQSPMRKLRRDRTRLQQDLALAHASDDKDQLALINKRIRDLDNEIAALEAKKSEG